MNLIVLSRHLIISRAVLLLLIVGLLMAFLKFTSLKKPSPVIREYYDCISAICTTLNGAGEACIYQDPRMAKVTIVAETAGKVIKIRPSTDRCE